MARLRQLTAHPAERILDLKDSLLLSEKQVADIQQQFIRFEAERDSLLEPIAEYVVAHGKKTRDEALQQRISKAQLKIGKAMVEDVQSVAALLSEEQRKQLPQELQFLLARKQS